LSVPTGLIEALKVRYAEPQRHYHTWAHIEALLGHFRRWESHFHRPEPVLWALCWHDAIYDPRASDNEERSARLLEQEAAGHLPPEDIAIAAQIIRATAGHRVPEGLTGPDADDLALFLDLDLSSFALPELAFAQMQHDIRAEYDFVPDDRFRTARKAILTDFLGRERLYLTDLAHAEWNQQARANLARSIAGLEAGA
jgi:predicted metal-dependent HD superfamily phosphohydrolase